MELGRRAFLKLAGGAAATATGYVGYEELNGGKWLFDPETLTAARNKFFGLVDYGTLYEVVEEYSDDSLDEVETPSGSLDPADLDQFAGVGSVSISGDNGVPTGVFAGAVAGSFEADIVEGPAEERSEIESAGGAGGYNLWTAEVPSVDSSELSLEPENVALGTRDGAVVGGAVRAPEADLDSTDAVRKMISAKNGSAGHARYLTNDQDYDSIRSQFDSNPTFLFGAMVDPALMTLSTAINEIVLGFVSGAAGPAGGFVDAANVLVQEWVEDLRAGAVGATMDTDAETTTMKAFLTYTNPDAAEQTGIVQLVNAASASADTDEFSELDARYQGRSIVVRATADTETLFEESTQAGVPSTTPTGFGRT
ncbi:MAG: hypothetical protein V5A41_15380 [Haloarculaceae archaeon]